MEEPWNPLEVAINVEPIDELVDLIDRRPSRVPDCLGVIATELRVELSQPRIDNRREVGCRAARVNAADPASLDECDAAASVLQQECRGDASQPAADDDHVDVEGTTELSVGWQLDLVPVWLWRRLGYRSALLCHAAVDRRPRVAFGFGFRAPAFARLPCDVPFPDRSRAAARLSWSLATRSTTCAFAAGLSALGRTTPPSALASITF